MPAPTIDDLVRAMTASPLGARAPVGVAGVLLLGWGARMVQLAVLLPGLVGGILLGVQIGRFGHLDGGVTAILAVVLALVGALACQLMERVAVRLCGAAVGAMLAWQGWLLVQHATGPWYVPTAGALVGGLVFPYIYELALKLLTALVGAACVAWAVGRPENGMLVLALAAAGVGLQVWLAKGGPAAPKGKAPGKKGRRKEE